MPFIDFRSMSRPEAIDLFEAWADAVPSSAAHFRQSWADAHSLSAGEAPSFREAIEWVRDEITWVVDVPADPRLPLWWVTGAELPQYHEAVAGLPWQYDPASARLVDGLCSWSTQTLLDSSPMTRLFLEPRHREYAYPWQVGDSIIYLGALQAAMYLLSWRYLAINPRKQDDDRDFVSTSVRLHETFADRAHATSGGRFTDGTTLTIKQRLGRGDLLAMDRVDPTTLQLILDPALEPFPDETEAFVAALAASRSHESAERQPDGRILVRSTTQTRTRLSAWAIKWWRPHLPDESRPRRPVADLEPADPGVWVIEFDDFLAHRRSWLVDKLVTQLDGIPGVTAGRMDREIIELSTTLPPADVESAVTTCWDAVFGDDHLIGLPSQKTGT